MPRPADGYKNKAGQQVPGVHDITNAYCPKPALVQWAYGRGKQGLPLYEKGALDIGTTVHAMAELHLKGDSDRDIEAKLNELRDPLDRSKARSAFGAFCEWREQFSVKSLAHEVTIVSETYQLGGTPDCIAEISGDIGLLDFKTCTRAPSSPYHEQLLAMAAHATLWNGEHPDQKIRSCHLIYLPKDGSTPKHHAYANYEAQWTEFACLLAAFAQKNGTPKPADARDEEIARLRTEAAAPPRPRTVRPAPKRRLNPQWRDPAPTQLVIPLPPPIALPPPRQAPMTMAELLRKYGHVRS